MTRLVFTIEDRVDVKGIGFALVHGIVCQPAEGFCVGDLRGFSDCSTGPVYSFNQFQQHIRPAERLRLHNQGVRCVSSEEDILRLHETFLQRDLGLETAATISQRDCRDCCRLHMGFGHTGVSIAATLCINPGQATLTLNVWHPRSYAGPAKRENEHLEAQWRRRSGTRKVPVETARAFLNRLTELRARTLADAPLRGRGGLSGYHVVASEGREHCFEFKQPHLYENHAYVDIIALYLDTFFGGYCAKGATVPAVPAQNDATQKSTHR